MRIRHTASPFALLALAALLSCTPDRGEHASPVEAVPAAQMGTAASVTSYYRITEVLPDQVPTLELAEVIGVLGGEIRLMGHTLTVPAGAVSEPALFTLRIVNNGYIEVDLTAVAEGLLGGLVDVGAAGFDKPVPITLTYARATNVSDPQRLKVMRLNDDGRHEILPTRVNEAGLTITAELDHFSRYCMITD